MRSRDTLLAAKAVLGLLACLILAGDAKAYTLPAPEFIGQFMALAGWAFVAFASMLLYPVYSVMRFFSGKRVEEASPAKMSESNVQE
jgi:hypothetical protein